MADRKISDLTALTAPAAGDYLPIVDISEVAAASKNKRITIEELFRGVPLGTAAAPSIAIEGDENTGIYSPGADQVAISTNGTGRLFVDASGNVQIQTPTSLGNLTVGPGSGDMAIALNGSGSVSSVMRLNFLGGGGGNPSAAVVFNRTANALLFQVGNAGALDASERVRITSAGLVGLGTSTPGRNLTVQNSSTIVAAALVSNPANISYLLFGDTDSDAQGRVQYDNSSDSLQLYSNGSERLRITSTGAVGIGTTTPGSTLEVNGTLTAQGNIFASSGGATRTITLGSTGAGLEYNVDGTTYLGGRTDAYPLAFRTNSIERCRLTSDGKWLVGTSTARANFDNSTVSARLQVEGVGAGNCYMSVIGVGSNNYDTGSIVLGRSAGTAVGANTLVSSGDYVGQVRFMGNDGSEFVEAANIIAFVDGTPGSNDMPGRLVFSTTADGASSPTERMRISQAGHVHVANTTGDYNTVGITLFSNGQAQANASGVNPLNLNRKTNDGKIIDFYRDTNNPGGISVTTTATTYATSSDYRLKENVVPLTGAIDRVNDLQVHRFNFIADPDKTVDGFIAHEAQAVVPECATGAKDELDADGNPVMQGIDQSKLVPLLTAALQEAIAEIASLKDRVAALEGA